MTRSYEIEHFVQPLGLPPLLIRPVRCDDRPALCAMVERLTEDDARFRFFVTMPRLPYPLALRMTSVDHDREMALIAIAGSDVGERIRGGDMLGIAHLVPDRDGQTAEVAVLIRSDVKRRRLGSILIRRLMDCAIERGVSAVHGTVLRVNEAMIGLCRSLRFSLEIDPDEPSAYRTVCHLVRDAGSAHRR